MGSRQVEAPDITTVQSNNLILCNTFEIESIFSNQVHIEYFSTQTLLQSVQLKMKIVQTTKKPISSSGRSK